MEGAEPAGCRPGQTPTSPNALAGRIALGTYNLIAYHPGQHRKGVPVLRLLLVLVLVVGAGGKRLHAEAITIASWNIADLHHQEGVFLRAFSEDYRSVARTAADFDLLATYRDRLGGGGTPADVIALQEIGTRAALDRLFPDDLYDTLLSSRWTGDAAPEGEGDVYTAIAVRRASGIRIVERDDLPGLAIRHTDGHMTRAGTGALLDFRGRQFWFLSVHLKSSCRDTKSVHLSRQDDCITLWRQIPALRAWIEERRASGLPFVIAGDFNREFRRFGDAGPVWKALNGVGPDGVVTRPDLVKYPIFADRACPTRRGNSTEPIDWFLVDARLAPRVQLGSFREIRYADGDISATRGGMGLSDHCPISFQIDVD